MLSALNDLDGKILDAGELEPDEIFSDKVNIYTVEAPEAPKEERSINAIFEQCKTHFRLSRNMPTCCEKSLMTINYYLVLLSQEQLNDELLGLKTKEEKLEKLREEMQKILTLMEREKVGDYKFKNTINGIVKNFVTNNPTPKECESALSELVTSLKTIRPFFF